MTDLHKAAQQALEALEATNKAMLANRDALAERGARPATNKAHQYLWDSSFAVYADVAIPAYAALREALAKPAVPEWIAISERMPPPDVWLLVAWGKHGAVDTAHTFAKWNHPTHPLGYLIQGHPGSHNDVTHWMLRPAAPQPKDTP